MHSDEKQSEEGLEMVERIIHHVPWEHLPFLSRALQALHFKQRGSYVLSSVLLLPFVLAPAFPGMAWPPFFAPSWAPLLKSWSSASRDPPSAQASLARRLPCLSSGLHSLVGCQTSTYSCASLV